MDLDSINSEIINRKNLRSLQDIVYFIQMAYSKQPSK